MTRSCVGILLVVALVAGGAASVRAQGLTGQISGTITDTSGGVLPGVTVVVKNVGTGLTRETVTGSDGQFLFPDLLAGTFDLTAKMQGFKTYGQTGIELSSTERVGLRPIAKRVIYVESDGPLARDYRKMVYTKVKRPIWPLDEETQPGLIF